MFKINKCFMLLKNNYLIHFYRLYVCVCLFIVWNFMINCHVRSFEVLYIGFFVCVCFICPDINYCDITVKLVKYWLLQNTIELNELKSCWWGHSFEYVGRVVLLIAVPISQRNSHTYTKSVVIRIGWCKHLYFVSHGRLKLIGFKDNHVLLFWFSANMTRRQFFFSLLFSKQQVSVFLFGYFRSQMSFSCEVYERISTNVLFEFFLNKNQRNSKLYKLVINVMKCVPIQFFCF